MNRKRKEKWEKIRYKGQSEFVVKEGGLKFGLLVMGLVIPALQIIFLLITNGYDFSFFDKEFQFRIIFSLIVGFPFGCFWGWLMWEWNEWNYSRHN